MKSPVLNVVIYEHIRERMWNGEEFSTGEIVDAVPAFHFFDEKNEEYDEEAVRELVNEIAQDMCEEFDFTWDESEDANFTYHIDEDLGYDDSDEDSCDCDSCNHEDECEDEDGWEGVDRLADSRGRITIPKKFLRNMGWCDGDDIYMGVYGNEVTISLNDNDLEDAKETYTLSPASNGNFQVVFNKLFDEVPDVSYRMLDVEYDSENSLIHIFVKD